MSIFMNLINGLGSVMNITCLSMAVFGTFLGIIIGALPGLTATTGVSIFLPMTFFMEPVPSFAFLLGIYCGGIYGGSITAILINTPGTPAAAATSMEGFPLAKQGKAMKALDMALYASFVGGVISCIALTWIAPILANLAMKFSHAEYFALGLFGISIVASLSAGNLVKGLIGACLGLLLGMIGLDPINSVARLTFGNKLMTNGITLIPALIALFAVSELFIQAEERFHQQEEIKFEVKGEHLKFKDFVKEWKHMLKGSLIGCFIGAVPATGGAVAAFFSYNEARRSARQPELFGKGSMEGIAASESANNGVTGSTLIPLLTLGIPGDSVTAVLLGALMVQGLTPGPLLFETDGDTVYGIFAILLICNFIMLILGALGIRLFYKITDVPKRFLQPVILSLCLIGTYASSTRKYELVVMLVIAIVAFFMVKAKIPTAPTLIALILGPTVESSLRRGMVAARGSLGEFLSRPVADVFLVITAIMLVITLIREGKAHREALKK
ncbi:MAG: tripartite tricarboxylate transporter permease [Lachnospiraceae bacterium]|nr:tripartite tricarboxylate transporter permease [Lachnospiraceae bacterium]